MEKNKNVEITFAALLLKEIVELFSKYDKSYPDKSTYDIKIIVGQDNETYTTDFGMNKELFKHLMNELRQLLHDYDKNIDNE